MDQEQAIKVIRKFVKALKQEGIAVDRVILYGSYAKGNIRRDSDIDVAVVSKHFGRDRVEEGMNLFRIAGKIDPRIEPVPFSSKSFENDTWIPLIYEIRQKGIEIELLG
jgi:predicted nucleotidyltransferase